MPYNEKSKKNLIPQPRGMPAPLGSGRPKGSKSYSTIIREMNEKEPEKFLLLNENNKRVIKELKKRGIKTIKELAVYKMFSQATSGDKEAFKILLKESGESIGDKITLTKINANIDYAKLTIEQLQSIINSGGFISDDIRRAIESQS